MDPATFLHDFGRHGLIMLPMTPSSVTHYPNLPLVRSVSSPEGMSLQHSSWSDSAARQQGGSAAGGCSLREIQHTTTTTIRPESIAFETQVTGNSGAAAVALGQGLAQLGTRNVFPKAMSPCNEVEASSPCQTAVHDGTCVESVLCAAPQPRAPGALPPPTCSAAASSLCDALRSTGLQSVEADTIAQAPPPAVDDTTSMLLGNCREASCATTSAAGASQHDECSGPAPAETSAIDVAGEAHASTIAGSSHQLDLPHVPAHPTPPQLQPGGCGRVGEMGLNGRRRGHFKRVSWDKQIASYLTPSPSQEAAAPSMRNSDWSRSGSDSAAQSNSAVGVLERVANGSLPVGESSLDQHQAQGQEQAVVCGDAHLPAAVPTNGASCSADANVSTDGRADVKYQLQTPLCHQCMLVASSQSTHAEASGSRTGIGYPPFCQVAPLIGNAAAVGECLSQDDFRTCSTVGCRNACVPADADTMYCRDQTSHDENAHPAFAADLTTSKQQRSGTQVCQTQEPDSNSAAAAACPSSPPRPGPQGRSFLAEHCSSRGKVSDAAGRAGEALKPLFVPIVLCMDRSDHRMIAEESMRSAQGPEPGLPGPHVDNLEDIMSRTLCIQDYLAGFEVQGLPLIRVQYGRFDEALDKMHEYILQCIKAAMRL